MLGAELAGTGADGGGEDLLKALGGGHFFDGFEILFLFVLAIGGRIMEGVKGCTLTVLTCSSRVASSSTTIIG